MEQKQPDPGMDLRFNPESWLQFTLYSMTLMVCELFSILLMQPWGNELQ
jgi:hypothetical protein